METSTNKSYIKLFALSGFLMVVISSCGLFKKKCDCPTWSKAPVEQPQQTEKA